MKFAIVDIETTGLYHQGHGITEISVVHLDENGIRPAFSGLIDPERNIPQNITRLTGIDDNMVSEAISLEEALPEVLSALEDRIFVAHNVNFDYQFLKSAFEKHGKGFNFKRICSLRYARKMVPELRSHRLSLLCRHFEITNHARHRAYGDAMATAELFQSLMRLDSDLNILQKLLSRSDHHRVLPANLDEKDVLNLPDAPGVYYFFGKTSKPIYIGKARSLKKRVLSHFTGAGSSRRKQLFQREVHRIEFNRAESEYHALLMEDAEIKKHWPKYNRAQKEKSGNVAVTLYRDRSNRERLAFVKKSVGSEILGWFNSLQAAKQSVYRSALHYGFDPQRAGLPLTEDFEQTLDREDEGFADFLNDCRNELHSSYALVDKRGNYYALMEGGRYLGYGALEETKETFDYEKALTPAPDSPTAKAIVRRMLSDDRIKRIPLR